ncbi:MAG TPA: ABC transporter substrate-binding protein [Gemmatimonadales bacterium]|jgi:branched-chain amino acid transport system substrate-binding protein|nr:ABC transporter substrate-binding protein [Gemmatimonadales bacterium]
MHTSARQSLLSVMLSAVIIGINHLYSIGPRAIGLGAMLLLVPAALLWWFRRTQSRVAFAGYLLMNAWIVIGFGLWEGLWRITLPLFLGTLLASLSTTFPSPTLGAYGFEATGILMFIGSLFVAYHAFTLVQVRRPTAAGGRGRFATGALLAVAVLVAAFVWTDQDRWTAPANGVVKIGVIVPKSGPFAILGNSFLKAVQVARQDLRGTKYQYQLVMVDVGSDPRTAGAAIQRAIRVDRVDAIVGGISLFGQVTKPLATKARILQTCVCSVTIIGDGAYNFTNIPTPEAEGIRWVQEARRRGITTVAMLSGLYPPSIQGHVTAVKTEAAREGVRIVSDQTFDTGTTDFRAMIERAEAGHPDVYYVEAPEPALDQLAQQLSATGIHDFTSVVAPSLSTQPELFEGTWYTDSDLRDFGFKRRFEEMYPGTQFATHMMPYAYDDFNLIVQAYERGQNPAVYVRNITGYEGMAGPVKKAPRSGNFESMPAVWTIKNGKPALVH